MFSYEIINNDKLNIDIKIINNIFKLISIKIKKRQKWILNIVFVDSNTIKNLNNTYRKIDKVTDVLSFHYFENFGDVKDDEIVGEIIMNLEKIEIQAIEYWLWNEYEFYKLLIHSILHIIWYDHEVDDDYKIMNQFEKSIWQEVFEK